MATGVVLTERVVVAETKLPDEADGGDHAPQQAPGSVCGVLQLAARKAVGCAAAGEAVVQGAAACAAQGATATLAGLLLPLLRAHAECQLSQASCACQLKHTHYCADASGVHTRPAACAVQPPAGWRRALCFACATFVQ
jgi:hypothetical protein